MANHYEVPNWAGKPPTGLHLDVMKGDKLIQKLMLDEKRCYLFGRNPQMNDFCIDHASCSRVHSAFVYHKHLNRAFLVDLGSTHGTYIGSMRLESQKPTQLPINSVFHFGASTRNYVIRERPSGNSTGIIDDISVDADGALLGLPETQTELDNMTEFNTAHNRRISMLGITTDDKKVKTARISGGKKQKKGVSFNEDVDIINPEDIDPTIGRFRNLVKTTIVPMGDSGVKRLKLTTGDEVHSVKLQEMTRHMHPSAMPLTPLYSDLPAPSHHQGPPTPTTPTALTLGGSMALLGTRLGLSLPNPAPDVDMYEELRQPPAPTAGGASAPQQPSEGPQPASNEPKKKIYAKEAWPGRKPALLSGV